MRAIRNIVCCGFIALLAAPNIASANTEEFSAIGATCIPITDYGSCLTISAGVLTEGTGCTVTCYVPISKRDVDGLLSGHQWYIDVTHSGSGVGTSISAGLYKVSRSTGAESTVVTATTTTSGSVHTDYTAMSVSFDFDSYFFYIRVTLTGGFTATRSLYGVGLSYF